eukprot:g998.t1.2.5e174188 g998  g998.t1 contig10:1155753-1157611(-)
MDLSPALSRLQSRYDADDRVEDGDSLGGLNWLLGGWSAPSRNNKSSATSLLSTGSARSSNTNYRSLDSSFTEGLRPISRSSSYNHSRQRMNDLVAIEPPPQATVVRQPPLDVLSQCVDASVSNIFGIYGVEVWRFDDSKLVNVPISYSSQQTLEAGSSRGGMYLKRVPQEVDEASPCFNSESRDAFERLTNPSRLDYLAPDSVEIGVGLAGILWSNASATYSTLLQHGVQSLSTKIHRRVGLLTGLEYETQPQHHNAADSIQWREVDAFAQDPHQPYDERLQAFAKAGLTLACGISFDIRGYSGVIIFFANPYADEKKLKERNNLRLIQFAAQFIASAASIQTPIEVSAAIRSSLPKDNWKRLRIKILAVLRLQRPLMRRRKRRSSSSPPSPNLKRVGSFIIQMQRMGSFASELNRERSFQMLRDASIRARKDIAIKVVKTQFAAKAKGMKVLIKMKGGDASLPPAFNFTQCYWTFVGVLITHVLLSRLDLFIVNKTNGEYSLVIAPLGALTTLQYNLTAAPASQPRNAIFGQLLALATAYSLHQVEMETWFRCALAPAIVATLTAK